MNEQLSKSWSPWWGLQITTQELRDRYTVYPGQLGKRQENDETVVVYLAMRI